MGSVATTKDLVKEIQEVYKCRDKWNLEREKTILDILSRTALTSEDISRYSFWDNKKSYTRNLIYIDDNFSLLILCWNPKKESKIHNHPCDGCFVKVVEGCLRETRYVIQDGSDDLSIVSEVDFIKGQDSMINDSIGLHKIGNPTSFGSVSLHLYTPPFTACKIWDSVIGAAHFQTCVTSVYDSEQGTPTAPIGGPTGPHSSLFCELMARHGIGKQDVNPR